jgi:hypothetical protein
MNERAHVSKQSMLGREETVRAITTLRIRDLTAPTGSRLSYVVERHLNERRLPSENGLTR